MAKKVRTFRSLDFQSCQTYCGKHLVNTSGGRQARSFALAPEPAPEKKQFVYPRDRMQVAEKAVRRNEMIELIERFEFHSTDAFFYRDGKREPKEAVDLTHDLLLAALDEKLAAARRRNDKINNQHARDKKLKLRELDRNKSTRIGEHLRSRTGIVPVIH